MLSDSKKRTVYDAGLYDPQEEEDEVRASELPFMYIQNLVIFSYCVAFMKDLYVCFSTFRGFLIFWKKCCLLWLKRGKR